MDSFDIRHKWSLTWDDVSRVMTLDFDLYLQGHPAMTLQSDIPVRPSRIPCPLCDPIVMNGLFPHWAQMSTSMRGCVAHYDRWSWPISSMSFSEDLATKLLKCDTPCRVRSSACTVLDGLCTGYLAVTLPILWITFIWSRSMSHGSFELCGRGGGYSSRSLVYNF